MRPLSRRRAPQLGGLDVPGIVIGGIGRAWAGTTRYTPIPGEPLDAGSAEQSGDGPPWEDAPRQRLAEMLIFTERRWWWACRTRNEELSIILLDDEPADSRRCVLVRFRRRKPEPLPEGGTMKARSAVAISVGAIAVGSQSWPGAEP